MELFANYVDGATSPVEWALRREAEGWHGLAVADHLWDRGRSYPHLWATLGAVAAVTTTPRLTSAFANNLLRSPVDAAQAALSLQQISGGRFELGLGAGWSEPEITGSGLVFPLPGERVSRYREAIVAVRALLRERSCRFEGEYYHLDVPQLGSDPAVAPPALIASLGGPRSIREIAPLVDRVEIKITSVATRGGSLDYAAFASIDADHVRDLVARVREANPTVALSTFIQIGCGADPRLVRLLDDLAGTWMGRFIGPPEQVAEALGELEQFGFDRLLLTPYTADTFELLAPIAVTPAAPHQRPG